MAFPKGAGNLRDRIGISRYVRERDSMGGYEERLSEPEYFYAQVNVINVGDSIVAGQEREIRTYEIIMRSGTYDVKQNDVIILTNGLRLKVRGVRPADRWLLIDCVIEVK